LRQRDETFDSGLGGKLGEPALLGLGVFRRRGHQVHPADTSERRGTRRRVVEVGDRNISTQRGEPGDIGLAPNHHPRADTARQQPLEHGRPRGAGRTRHQHRQGDLLSDRRPRDPHTTASHLHVPCPIAT